MTARPGTTTDAALAQVMCFARTLRAAGMPIGTGRVIDAVVAAAEVNVRRRDDLYWALHATLVSRCEDRALFDEAFRLFWREPDALPAGVELLLPRAPPGREAPRPVARRLADALGRADRHGREPASEVQIEARLEWSDREALRTKDFEQMSAEEIHAAEVAIDSLALPATELRTRRFHPDARGDRVDPRAMLRAALRTGRDFIPFRWRSPSWRPPDVVVLVDVSGSMTRYARMLLRFLHALTRRRTHVHSFTFATRLTNVTRHLLRRDPDAALAAVGRAVRDWEGGTRIGAALRDFNVRWARRVLGRGAAVLLVTDGLDRDDAHGLAEETARLRRSCRRLIWLNPLLRYQGFEPRAAGIRAILPHVDEFLPVHDLASVEQLAAALSGGADRRRRARAEPAPASGRRSAR